MQSLLLVSNSPETANKAGFIVFHPERNNIIRMFCPLKNYTWKSIAHISDFGLIYVPPRTKRKFTVESGYIYIIGGYDNIKRKFLRTILRYDLLRGVWFHCKKMNTRRACFTPFLYDGKVFCAGGYTSKSTITDNVESYEPLMDIIENEEPLPSPCSEYGCAYLRKKVFLIGGKIQFKNEPPKACSHFWSFEGVEKPVANHIGIREKVKMFVDIEKARLPVEDGIIGHKVILCEKNNRIYIVGGTNILNGTKGPIAGIYYVHIDTIMAYIENRNGNEAIWYKRSIPELQKSYNGAVLINNKIFTVGGLHHKMNSEDSIMEVDEEEPLEHNPKSSTLYSDNINEKGIYFLKNDKHGEVSSERISEEVGYFDWRRKTYNPLYSLRNKEDINLENVHCVLVDMNDKYAEFNRNRYDWLLQWPLW